MIKNYYETIYDYYGISLDIEVGFERLDGIPLDEASPVDWNIYHENANITELIDQEIQTTIIDAVLPTIIKNAEEV